MTKTPEQYEAEIKVLVEALLKCNHTAHYGIIDDQAQHSALLEIECKITRKAIMTYQAQAEVWRRKEEALKFYAHPGTWQCDGAFCTGCWKDDLGKKAVEAMEEG